MGGMSDALASAIAGAEALGEEIALVAAGLATASIGAVDFWALPPEVNSARLTFGPGPAPMLATAASYAEMADALAVAASASDGSMNAMAASWSGDSGARAEGAFRRHAEWLRQQSHVAAGASKQAAQAAAANAQARATMVPLPVIIANRVAAATLAATNSAGQNTAAMAVNEALYLAMWGEAAMTMQVYAAETAHAISQLPPPVPPPPITTGDLGPSVTPDIGPKGGPSGGPTTLRSGPRPDTSDTGRSNSTGGQHANDTGKTGNEGIRDSPDHPGTSTNSTDPTQSVGPDTEAQRAMTDIDNALQPMNDSLADPGVGGNSFGIDDQGFYGTSPYSPTLAGLSGGVGSSVALSMMRGGLGSMSGASTGFRLPTNWNPAGVRAFGATSAPPAGGSGPLRRPPTRGAVAPKAQMRRRRDKKDEQPSKVFVPGEFQEVPVLEKPPIIGVIEYDEGDRPEDVVSDASPAVGVIDRNEEDSDSDSVLAVTERPR